MNPQPPVTSIRTAPTSSADEVALADFPTVRSPLEEWQKRLAETDWTPWLIVGLAALLRLLLLGIKPPHFDEGINGWFVDQLVRTHFYRYDPTNYHGPLHFYVLFLCQTLFGRNLWALRLPVVTVSVTCVWLLLKFEPFVGRKISRIAALAMAISPGFVFYGRYSIHEVWLVLFSILFILGLLGLWRMGTPPYLWCAGMGLTGMVLTKETYIIHVACALLAIPVTLLSAYSIRLARPRSKKQRTQGIDSRWFIPFFAACLVAGFLIPPPLNVYLRLVSTICILFAIFFPPTVILTPVPDHTGAKLAKQTWDSLDLAMIVVTGAALIVLFYSGTFYHWSGVKGLYQSYAAWFTTGSEGHGHEKPWYYWLKLIIHYEWPALIGLVLCLFAAWIRNISVRYLAIYGVGTLVAYSIVNYKTPWCIISIIWPLLFVFGAAATTQTMQKRIFYGALGAIAGALLGVFLSYLFVASDVRAALGEKSYLSAVFELLALSSGGDFSTRIDHAFFITVIITTALGALAGVIMVAKKRSPWFSDSIMKWIRTFVVSLALIGSFAMTIALNYFRCTTDTEPYVYVQTYNDIFKLTRPILELAGRDPIFYQMKGHIIRNSSYPLPWILGDFPHVGYYEREGALPAPVDADFLLVQPDRIQEVEPKLENDYFTEPLTIRPYQETSKLYLDAKKFKQFFPGQAPNFHGKGPG